MSTSLLKKINQRTINIALTVLFGILLIIALKLPTQKLFINRSETVPLDIFVQMEDGKSVTSELIRPIYGNTIKSINVLLGTNSRINEGELTVELLREDEVIESWTIPTAEVPDCQFYTFECSESNRFESGNRYYVRVTNFCSEFNNLAVGMAYGNGDITSDINNCQGQSLCSFSYSYNNSLASKAYIMLSLLAIVIVVFLCLKTGFLNLPTYKLVISLLVSICLTYIIQFDIFQSVNNSVVIRSDEDTEQRQSIEPGQTCEFDFSEFYDKFDTLAFHVYGDNKSEYLVSLINKSTNTTYFVNSEISITQRRQIADGAAMVLNCDASLCPDRLFEEGDYVLSIINTSPDTVLDIGINAAGSDESNPSIAVSLVRNTLLGNYIAVASSVLLVLYIVAVYYLVDSKKINSERFFLVSIIPLSLIILVLFQVNNVPDAEAHFVSAYHLSNTMLGIRGDREWMARACDAAFYQSLNWWAPVPNPDMRIMSHAIHHLTGNAGDTSLVSVFPDYSKMLSYSFLNWFPQALGLTIGRLIGANTVVSIYLGRVAILIVYILACLRAIKNTPVGKFIFCAIALSPVNLMLSSSFSYDCMFLLASLNFTAIILKLRSSITRNGIIEALIYGFILGSIKGGGALILLPLVLLLLKKDKKSIYTVLGILAISGFAVLLFGKILAPKELFQFGVEGDGNLTAQFALYHPIVYLRMIARSYIECFNDYCQQIIGAAISWVEPIIPDVFVFALVGLTLLGALAEEDTLKLNNKDKAIMSIPVVASIFLTPAMLLSYTPMGGYMVFGIQGRYYSSIFPLILILLAGYFFDMGEKKNNIKNKVFSLFSLIICISVYYMLRKYLLR